MGTMLRSPEPGVVVGGLTLLGAALRALPAPLKTSAGSLEAALLELLLPAPGAALPAARHGAVVAMAALPGSQVRRPTRTSAVHGACPVYPASRAWQPWLREGAS